MFDQYKEKEKIKLKKPMDHHKNQKEKCNFILSVYNNHKKINNNNNNSNNTYTKLSSNWHGFL